MARIRTIKPEFWDSPGIGTVSPWARLLYIAMWNWADDAGRGEANLKRLEGFAFPQDDMAEIHGTSDAFRFLVAEVVGRFGVIFYEVDGRPYYEIPSWKKHQRNERIAQGKYPPSSDGHPWDFHTLTSEGAELPTSSAAPQRNTAERPTTSAPVCKGTGEQGNRGTGEEQPSSATPKQTAITLSLFDEFWKAYPRRVGKQAAVKAWRRAVNQAPPTDIVDAAVAMAADPNLPDAEFIPHPSKWLNDGRWSDGPYPERTQGRASPPRQSTAEQRAATGWNLVQQLRAEEENEYLNHVLEIGPAS